MDNIGKALSVIAICVSATILVLETGHHEFGWVLLFAPLVVANWNASDSED